jgi:tetratricopeptide (TPR) repeat protein
MSDIQRQQAAILFERAYKHQMRGELADAILLYKRSFEASPTAEAHTFLGWTYSMMSRYEEAVLECEKAIAVDPTFGNPYNDIGAYLIELGRWEEAIPWLEKATTAHDMRCHNSHT